MAWIEISDVQTTWTTLSEKVRFGVPYNSDLPYNGDHTYNEATVPFRLLWIDSADSVTAWS